MAKAYMYTYVYPYIQIRMGIDQNQLSFSIHPPTNVHILRCTEGQTNVCVCLYTT